jgi:hypothetical protein
MATTTTDSPHVTLVIKHVYRSTSVELLVPLHSTTVGSIKRKIQELLEEKPAPNNQRLIYFGKVCGEEGVSLAVVLAGGNGGEGRVSEGGREEGRQGGREGGGFGLDE